MSLTENSNQVFLSWVEEHGSFPYAICKVISACCIKCNTRHAVEQKYIIQMSTNDVSD